MTVNMNNNKKKCADAWSMHTINNLITRLHLKLGPCCSKMKNLR